MTLDPFLIGAAIGVASMVPPTLYAECQAARARREAAGLVLVIRKMEPFARAGLRRRSAEKRRNAKRREAGEIDPKENDQCPR